MREDILEASVRVLRREGPLRFTTARVAKAAGVSVGSLYQYYPNKQSLLFALHWRVVEAGWIEVQAILDDDKTSPRQKIHAVARMYFRVETEDVRSMGAPLQDVQVFFANEPAHRAMNQRLLQRFTQFVREALPDRASETRVEFGGQVLVTVILSVGKAVAAQQLPQQSIDHRAAACADMVSDFLDLE